MLEVAAVTTRRRRPEMERSSHTIVILQELKAHTGNSVIKYLFKHSIVMLARDRA